jgi:hypothetical protein
LFHLDGFLRSRGPGILQPGAGHGVRCVQTLANVDLASQISVHRGPPPQRGAPFEGLILVGSRSASLRPLPSCRSLRTDTRSMGTVSCPRHSARERRFAGFHGAGWVAPVRVFLPALPLECLHRPKPAPAPPHPRRPPGCPAARLECGHTVDRSRRASTTLRARSTSDRTPCRSEPHCAPRSREDAPPTEVGAITVDGQATDSPRDGVSAPDSTLPACNRIASCPGLPPGAASCARPVDFRALLHRRVRNDDHRCR